MDHGLIISLTAFLCAKPGLYDTIIDGLLLCSSKYNIVRCDRHDGSRGGSVCAFMRDNLNFTALDLPTRFFNLEILCIE